MHPGEGGYTARKKKKPGEEGERKGVITERVEGGGG